MTKKELIAILQMVYDNIPECTCTIEYTDRNLVDPGCIRHFMLLDEEINYIRIALGNIVIIDAAQEFPTSIKSAKSAKSVDSSAKLVDSSAKSADNDD